MPEKILVTGATGFIGYHVIHELLGKGFEVVASSSSIEKARITDWFDRVTYVQHQLETESKNENLKVKFGNPSRLIHLAWQGLPNYKSLFHFEDNLPVHYNFIKQVVNDGITDITVTGTCFEYGMKEGSLNESMVPEPANPYGIAKNTLRVFLEQLQKEKPFSLKWIRLFYMYGKGQNPKSLLSQLDNALTNGEKVFNMSGGEQLRDYLPVEEVASYIVTIATQNKVTGIINCSSNNPVTIKDLIQKHIQNSGKSIKLNLGYYPYSDFEPMQFWGDNQKLKSILSDGIH